MQVEKNLYLGNREKIIKSITSHSVIVDFFPKEMDIEITSYCNYRCTMCPHSLTGNHCANNMSFEQLKKLQDLFPYCKRVMIQGDGEPLVHPDFIEISNFISGFGCRLCTTTNLSLLSEETARVLAEQYELVTVSCDAGNKSLYETIRVNGDFEKFSNNLRLLMSYADPNRVVVNAVIMRQNIDSLDELLHYLSNYGIKKVVFSNLLTTEHLKNVDDSISLLGEYAVDQLIKSEETARNLGIELIINWDYKSMVVVKDKSLEKLAVHREFSQSEITEFINEYKELRTIDKSQTIYSGKYHCQGICKNLYEKVYVDVNGNMTLCCYGKMRPIANIFEEDFDSIWNGPIYQNCRKAFFSGNLPNFCIGCRYAMAANKYEMQAYTFKISDIDENFADDDVFWENRKSK